MDDQMCEDLCVKTYFVIDSINNVVAHHRNKHNKIHQEVEYGVNYMNCPCSSFQKNKKTCIHIKSLFDAFSLKEIKHCTWNTKNSKEKQEKDGVCPRCGGRTVKSEVFNNG